MLRTMDQPIETGGWSDVILEEWKTADQGLLSTTVSSTCGSAYNDLRRILFLVQENKIRAFITR